MHKNYQRILDNYGQTFPCASDLSVRPCQTPESHPRLFPGVALVLEYMDQCHSSRGKGGEMRVERGGVQTRTRKTLHGGGKKERKRMNE